MISNILDVFIHPVSFMERRGFDSGPWIPLLLVAVCLALLRASAFSEARTDYSSEEFKKWYSEHQQVDEAQAERDIARLNKIAPFTNLIEAPILVIAGAGGAALLLYIIGRIGYRRKLPFLDIFNMVAWTGIVGIIPILMQLVFNLSGIDATLPTNLTELLPKDVKGGYFYFLFQTIDLFLIWQVWLIGLGMARLYEIGRQRSVAGVGTLFIMLAILNAMAMTITAGK